MTDVALSIVRVLADDTPRDTGPDFGKASPLGLVVVVILLICTFALVWSMNRHLKQLPESFDREHPEADQAVDDGTVGSADEPTAGAAPAATSDAGAAPAATSDAGAAPAATSDAETGNPRREPGG